MNPFFVVIASVVGKVRECGACGKRQVVDRLDQEARYHCKNCGHVFTRQELKGNK